MKLRTRRHRTAAAPRPALTPLFSPFRRKNVLRIPRGWIYYLAPEIVKRMSPEVDEDQLPFSRAADVYAFGYLLVLDHGDFRPRGGALPQPRGRGRRSAGRGDSFISRNLWSSWLDAPLL